MNIFLAFDLDYVEDYNYLDSIFKAIGSTPATFFLAGSRHPSDPYHFPPTAQIGNHSFMHEEWYGMELRYRLDDLLVNHEWLKKMYGVDCQVYRSPHLRNFPDTADAMEKKGYKREMECVECTVCKPMEHAHLKQYFSSHHHFQSHCNMSFLEGFESICKQGKDFTFFLDPHHFTPERIHYLTDLIHIGNKYGTFKLL
jgi:peptidoglycan/xylan/chitin deacetylase (PgdA/CDA1 family)